MAGVRHKKVPAALPERLITIEQHRAALGNKSLCYDCSIPLACWLDQEGSIFRMMQSLVILVTAAATAAQSTAPAYPARNFIQPK
jgi:hypothetical protein